MLSNTKTINKLFLLYIIVVLALNVLPINSPSSKLNNIYLLEFRGDYIVHLIIFIPWMLFRGMTFIPISFLKWIFFWFCVFISNGSYSIYITLPGL